MIGRNIPRNPNRPVPAPPLGLQPHWVRTIVLLIGIGALVMLRLPGQIVADTIEPTTPTALGPTPALAATGGIVANFEPIPADDVGVRSAIDRANQVFQSARMRADITALSEVATGAWLEYERSYIARMQAQGTAERWSLKAVSITGVAVHGDRATVCTDEQWDRVIVAGDGTPGPGETLRYVERYALVRQGQAWLVSEIQYEPERCQV